MRKSKCLLPGLLFVSSAERLRFGAHIHFFFAFWKPTLVESKRLDNVNHPSIVGGGDLADQRIDMRLAKGTS